MSLSFVPLGVGDAFSSRYYSFCIAVEADGHWLLVDCPHPIRKMLREGMDAAGLSIDLPDIEAIALTHLHADHCSGIEGYAFFNRFALHRLPTLASHPEAMARLWEGHMAAGMEQLILDGVSHAMSIDDYFDVKPLSYASAVQLGPFSIECRRTNHHVPTTAFRITGGGRTLGISADTSFDPELIAWLSTSDLFIHETNYGIHTDYRKLAALPPELRARMRLIHYPDDFDLDGSVIEPLRQGRRYTV